MSGAPTYPKAQVTLTGLDGGSYVGGPPRGVWHETITAPSAFYTGNTYYHIQFRQWPLTAAPECRQFIRFDRASRALRNLGPSARADAGLTPEDIQTNREGSVNINAALVGYQTAKAGGYPSLYPLTDAMVNEISEFIVWCEAEWGIPADCSSLLDNPGVPEFGYLAPERFDNQEWADFTGWTEHARVTENTHQDTYYLFARQMKPLFPGGTQTQEDTMLPIEYGNGLDDISGLADPSHAKKNPAKRSDVAVVQGLLNRALGTKLVEDGYFDDAMAKAILGTGISASSKGYTVTGSMYLKLLDGAYRSTSSGKDETARKAIAELKSGIHAVTAP